MRPLHKNSLAQAGCSSAGPPRIPTREERVFYSPSAEPALVASTPVALHPSARRRAGRLDWQAAKESLAGFLVRQLLEWKLPDLTLGRDSLGKPQIWLGGAPGPALSFSWSAGRLWAAVCRSESGLGLDAAAPLEFAGSYPHRRVFSAAEWQAAVTLAAGNREEAGALLWSVKEAVVKAWGWGFHFLSPLQVEVKFAGLGEHGYLWCGRLTTPGREGGPPADREPGPAVSVRLKEVWLSVAWGR